MYRKCSHGTRIGAGPAFPKGQVLHSLPTLQHVVLLSSDGICFMKKKQKKYVNFFSYFLISLSYTSRHLSFCTMPYKYKL